MVKKAPFSFQRYLKLSGHQKFTAHKYLDSFWLLTKTNDFQAFSPRFGPFWTSNCYIIIEYTENLIKPSDSLLKTVLDRVSALVPEFKIDQNMLFFSHKFHHKTSRTAFENSEHSFNSEPYGTYYNLLINSVYTHYMAKPSMAKLKYLRL